MMSWQLWKIAASRDTSKVFALLSNGSDHLTVVFEYNADSTQRLESQVYLDLCALDDHQPTCFFPNKPAICSAAVKAVESVCADGRETTRRALQPGQILQISTADGTLCGSLVDRSAEFAAFCSSLKQPAALLGQDPGAAKSLPDVVGLEVVRGEEPFQSYRGACMKVSLSKNPKEFLVFKGVTFFDYLQLGPESFQYHLAACYREIHMINTALQQHPNIMPPPKALVVMTSSSDGATEQLVNGSIYPIYKNGSLSALLNKAREEKYRISVERKAKWCSQLASVMHHVHFVARVWHQDLKPPNMLLDDADNILVIDWEQCGANSFVLAPEANGAYDVVTDVEGIEDRRALRYTAYNGPRRVNDPIAIPEWNVFPHWVKECPDAVELAEVYSLGKTMWLILEQVKAGHEDGKEDYTSESVRWSDWSEDIPQSWKGMVRRCIEADPNSRVRLKELCEFWEDQLHKLEK